MAQGGVRRVEVPGSLVGALAYPTFREMDALGAGGNVERYRRGPKPSTFAGQRALDFVLDNRTLKVRRASRETLAARPAGGGTARHA